MTSASRVCSSTRSWPGAGARRGSCGWTNGPELTSHGLRDWCRFSHAGSVFIEPGCPWQNPFVESFHSRVRDELLNGEQFACIAEARVLIGDWREDYNQRRPHSALQMQAPAVFAAAYTTTADA